MGMRWECSSLRWKWSRHRRHGAIGSCSRIPSRDCALVRAEGRDGRRAQESESVVSITHCLPGQLRSPSQAAIPLSGIVAGASHCPRTLKTAFLTLLPIRTAATKASISRRRRLSRVTHQFEKRRRPTVSLLRRPPGWTRQTSCAARDRSEEPVRIDHQHTDQKC